MVHNKQHCEMTFLNNYLQQQICLGGNAMPAGLPFKEILEINVSVKCSLTT